MRGRDIRGHSFAMVAGITPAYAGKSTRLSRIQHCAEGSPPRMRGRVPTPRPRLIKSQDHPRVCGEEHHPTPSSAAPRGSPPRMRGKDAIQRHPSCGFGITPACAGKRRTDSKTTLSHEDHPRVCGEKTPFSENSFTKSGSPPRVRGKACAICTFPLSQRITPACAGKRPRCGARV